MCRPDRTDVVPAAGLERSAASLDRTSACLDRTATSHDRHPGVLSALTAPTAGVAAVTAICSPLALTFIYRIPIALT